MTITESIIDLDSRIESTVENQNITEYEIEIYILNTVMSGIGAKPLSFTDRTYYTIQPENVKNIIDIINTKSEYINEDHDCDDYAFTLKGLFSKKYLSKYAVGWCKSDTHAFNFFLDRDFKIWIIEPQQNRVFEYNDSVDDMYKITHYII